MPVKKTTAKKTTKKKVTVRKKVVSTSTASPRKKVAARRTPGAPRPKAIATKQTKTQILQAIAEDTDLSRKEVAAVFASLNGLVRRHMMQRGSGEFTIPDTGIKIRKVRKLATKARKGVNPFTGEPMVIKAKPAHNVVKLSALKALKELLL